MKTNLKITCKEASYLLSKQQETKISYIQKIQLSVHIAICNSCKLFKNQIIQISTLLKTKTTKDTLLNTTKKTEIKKALEIEIKKN